MSRLLASVSAPSLLSDSRRERIRWLLSVLQSQRFYAPAQDAGAPPQALPGYGFMFDSCSQALEAWHERLPRLVELIKAMAIAELEVKGDYREAEHDAVFGSFGANRVGAAELARFPDYLVRLDADTLAGGRVRPRAGCAGVRAAVEDPAADRRHPGSARRRSRAAPRSGCAAARWPVPRSRWATRSCCSQVLRTCRGCASKMFAGLGWSRPGAVFGVFRRERARRRHPTLSGRRGGDGVARVSGLRLRPVGGGGLGRPLQRRRQPAARAGLSGASAGLRGRGAPARRRDRRLHGGRLPGLRPTLRRALRAGAARGVERADGGGGRRDRAGHGRRRRATFPAC